MLKTLVGLLVVLCCCHQLSAQNKALKADLEDAFVGKSVVSKIVFGGKAKPSGQWMTYPVNTLVYPDSNRVIFRVESGTMRSKVGDREMKQQFDQGTSLQVTGVDLKDDRLELSLKSGSGDSAKLKLMLGSGWQSKFDVSSVQAQLARFFVLNEQPALPANANPLVPAQPALQANANPPVPQQAQSSQPAQPAPIPERPAPPPTHPVPDLLLKGIYVQQRTGLTPLKPVHPSFQSRVGGFIFVSGGGYWALGGRADVQISETHHPHFVLYGMDDEFVIVQLDTKSHRRELQISSVIAGPLGASAKTGFNSKKQTNLLVTKRDDGGLDLNPVRDLAGGEYLIMTEEVPQKVYDFSIK